MGECGLESTLLGIRGSDVPPFPPNPPLPPPHPHPHRQTAQSSKLNQDTYKNHLSFNHSLNLSLVVDGPKLSPSFVNSK